MRTKQISRAELPAPLLKRSELQEHYNISRWTVGQWLKNGCPARLLPSGHRRFDLAEVEAWLDEQEPNAASA